MRQAGEELAVKIENRTLAGRDENDALPPWHNRRTARTFSRVAMFKDFGVTSATRRGFTLGFRSRRSERIAEYHQHVIVSNAGAGVFRRAGALGARHHPPASTLSRPRT